MRHAKQVALQEALDACEAAQRPLAELTAQRAEFELVQRGLERDIETARSALRDAVTESEIRETSERHRELLAMHGSNVVRLEGFTARVAAAEQVVSDAQRDLDRVAAELACTIARTMERQALELARKLAPIRSLRRGFARFAAAAATNASGHTSDPLGGTSVNERTTWSTEVDDILAPDSETPNIDYRDLLSAEIT